MLRKQQIQSIVKRESHDTPDQPQKIHIFVAEWVYPIAANSENSESTMRRCQGYADTRAEPVSFRPFFETRKSVFCVPIGSMKHLLAFDSRAGWQIFHWEVGHGHRTLAPNESLDFVGIFFQHQ